MERWAREHWFITFMVYLIWWQLTHELRRIVPSSTCLVYFLKIVIFPRNRFVRNVYMCLTTTLSRDQILCINLFFFYLRFVRRISTSMVMMMAFKEEAISLSLVINLGVPVEWIRDLRFWCDDSTRAKKCLAFATDWQWSRPCLNTVGNISQFSVFDRVFQLHLITQFLEMNRIPS